MATYEICGTCSIHCDGTTTSIRFFPAVGYLTPNKDRAVLYPTGENSASSTAFLETLKFDDINQKPHWLLFEGVQADTQQLLQFAAATQRKSKLIVEEEETNLTIVQCFFPAP